MIERVKQIATQWAAQIALVATVLALAAAAYYAWQWNIRHQAQMDFRIEQKESEISNLKSELARASARAEAREKQIRNLEARLPALERTADDLRRRLRLAEDAEQKRAAELAALPLSEVGKRLEALELHLQVSGASEADQRRVLQIAGDRDSCREQLGLSEIQAANCEERGAVLAAVRAEQSQQISDFKFQISNQQEIMRRQDELRKLEVAAARGTWVKRAWNKSKFWVGLAVGAMAGTAAAR